ncbi:unnamed protein product, partial [Amoebophrya sp. A25]
HTNPIPKYLFSGGVKLYGARRMKDTERFFAASRTWGERVNRDEQFGGGALRSFTAMSEDEEAATMENIRGNPKDDNFADVRDKRYIASLEDIRQICAEVGGGHVIGGNAQFQDMLIRILLKTGALEVPSRAVTNQQATSELMGYWKSQDQGEHEEYPSRGSGLQSNTGNTDGFRNSTSSIVSGEAALPQTFVMNNHEIFYLEAFSSKLWTCIV